jgi:hypothetical protein
VEERLGRVSGKMPVAKALRYLLNHWDGLGVFLDDGRVETDSNSIERWHRVVATVHWIGRGGAVQGHLHLAHPDRPPQRR